MVNVISCAETNEVDGDEVVIRVQGMVDIRVHGRVHSEEMDIRGRRTGDSEEVDSRGRDTVVCEDVPMGSDRVDNEGVTGERDRVDCVGVTEEGDRVDSEGVTKERDRVDSEGVTKERDRVDSEGVTKERDRVDSEGVTKERDRVDSESVTKERDRVDSEGVTQERDRVDSEGVTKERDRVDTNGVSAKVLAEQNSQIMLKASNHSNNNNNSGVCCTSEAKGDHHHRHQQDDYQQRHRTIEEASMLSNRGCLPGVDHHHTPTRLTLYYKPSMLASQVVKYLPRQVIVRAKGECVTFGRSLTSDVPLNDDCMSRNYATLWLPDSNSATFKLRNLSSSKDVMVDNVMLYSNSDAEVIFGNNSKIVLDNIELTAAVRQGNCVVRHYEVKIEPIISRSTSLQQEPTWMSSSRNVGATAHQTENIVSATYRRSEFAHSRYHSTGPVEHGITNEISRNILPEEN